MTAQDYEGMAPLLGGIISKLDESINSSYADELKVPYSTSYAMEVNIQIMKLREVIVFLKANDHEGLEKEERALDHLMDMTEKYIQTHKEEYKSSPKYAEKCRKEEEFHNRIMNDDPSLRRNG